jgi:N-acetyl-alpha-D-glucosaminyl L-malate synthase BshA
MKIGIVLYPTFGGSGVVATELGKSLAEKGHLVHFISYSHPVRLGNFRQNIYYHEVQVTEYPLFEYQPYETELASKIVDVVKYEGLDILHVHYAIPHASAAFMAQQILKAQGLNIPFITTLHGTDITLVGKDPSFEPVISFCINASNAVTAVSNSLREDTLKHFHTQREIHVIPNFIQARTSLPERNCDTRRMYASDDEFILCHISNMRPVKRVLDVVSIFYLVQQHVKAKLILAGDGPDRTLAERMGRELGIHHNIIFTGNVRETSQILAISDLFLLPSETESFGLAALEAMAQGVPVISSNTGGIPEVNRHGVSGFTSPVGNVEEMALHALSLLNDESRLLEFKQNALLRAREYDITNILPLYEKLYLETINNQG